jgi:hypothetical protein
MPIASLAELPLTLRALFSSFLLLMGIAYLMALFLLFLVDVDQHERMGMGLVSGIVAKYHGTSGRGTRLEAALRGVMADKIDPVDRDRVLRWLRAGAPAAGYAAIKLIFDKNCVACHNASSAPQLPPLANYQDIRKLTQIDTGPSLAQLAQVSHVHLFGISIVFLLTGVIFSMTETPVWLRVSLVVIPYLAILADIGSWWLTRFDPVFGIVVVVGGALMGLSLAGQILIALWEMWLPVPWSRALAGAVRP